MGNIMYDSTDLDTSLHEAFHLAVDRSHKLRYAVRNTGCQRAETLSMSQRH